MTSSNRRSLGIPVKIDSSTSRSSGEGSTRKVTKMKEPASFHGSLAPSSTERRTPKSKKKTSSSFTANQCCDIHPEVKLGGKDGNSCPECAIQVMKLAARHLERRAAELELERKEKELEEKARKQRRKERKLVASSLTHAADMKGNFNRGGKKLSDDDGEGRQEDTQAMRRWSTAFEYETGRRSSEVNPPPTQPRSVPCQTKSKPSSKKGTSRPRLRRQFSLGQVANSYEIDEPSSRADTLIKIARLREGDGAWVKRSDDYWTYATLKAREDGPDASLVFTVNDRGSSKKFPVTKWAKFVRLVAENVEDDYELEMEEEEDDEIMMMSDLTLNDDKGAKNNKCRGDEHLLEKSLDTFATFASESTTGSSDTLPSKDSYSSRGSKKEKVEAIVLKDLKDHEVSMYTFGLQDEDEHFLQDEDLPMCTSRLKDKDGHSNATGLQDKSCSQIVKFEQISEEEKPKLKVSFNIPQDEGVRSSMTSVSESSSCDNYDADAEETGTKNEITFAGKAKTNITRSKSLPLSEPYSTCQQHNKQSRLPKCRPIRRTSLCEINDGNEKIKVDTKRPKNKKQAMYRTYIPKKKLQELNIGGAIPKHHGQVRQESFYSALKSIQRRSSVMMPTTSSAAVNLD
eukprot:CAMPEP_0172533716 /NCGR_PEP_ID=MMETSP1067-20121228/6319_1 /TAXON_ID=265564 ORGANISM="Thalassiosira punctigera, Strain Tpunct2005C2" /NCGR_SAMPLE_ID=MMETSP1067 /ASSEMBLY_ACC=CAM_ASM_000444 /LENGTH=627 /DNA_ID=CAMNT_0013318389 /DNA_START=27 /DNA_END=1910 /DNA_ORIENTATION=+